MRKKLLLAALVAVLVVVPISAQYYPFATEPTQLANNYELVAVVANALKIYQQSKQIYDLAAFQARMLVNLNAYQSKWPAWLYAASADAYNKNGGFIRNANGEPNSYQNSVRPLPVYGPTINTLSSDSAELLRWQYATAELGDAVNQGSLNAVAVTRANAHETQAALSRLDAAVYSSDPDANTAVAVANKTSIGVAISAHQNEDIKRLLVASVEQQTLATKIRRDEVEVAATEHYQRIERAGEPVQETAKASEKIRGFRF